MGGRKTSGTSERAALLRRVDELVSRESQLRQSCRYLRQLFDHAPLGYQSLDENGCFLEVNQAWLDVFGYRLEEVVGHSFSAFLAPDWRPAFQENFARFKETGEISGIEFEMVRRDGSTLLVAFYGRISRDAEGGFVQTHCIFHDITARRQSERALQESEERFRTLFRNVPSFAVQGYSPDGTVLFWNKAAERLYGYSAGEAIGRDLKDLIIPPELRPEVEAAIAFMAATGRPIPASELLLMRKDGSRVPVYSSHLVVQVGDQARELFCIDMDLSELKRTEQALQESEGRLRIFIEHAPVALAMFDCRMCYLYASRRWLSDYGLEGRELHGRSHYEIFPEIPERWRKAHRRGMAGEVLREEADRFERADGSVQWLHWELRPWLTGTGEIGGIVIFTEDITERCKALAELKKSREDFARAQEVAAMGSWRLDLRRDVLTWSAENHRIFGVPLGTPMNYQTFLGLVHPEDREFVDNRWQAALSGESYDIEHRIVVGGEVKWVREKAFLEFDDQGKPTGGFGITQDITLRWLAAEQLSRSEERHRVLAETLLSGVVHLGGDGSVRAVNQAAENILGRDRAQLIGWPLFHEQERAIRENGEPFPAEEHPSLTAARTGQAVRGVVMGLLDGPGLRCRWLKVDAVPVYFQGTSQAPEVFLVIEDVTEHKLAESLLKEKIEQLKASNAELEIFNTAAVGRELRMIELKREINELCGQLGLEPRYPLDFEP